MFVFNRHLSIPVSGRYIRKYYANLRAPPVNRNRLIMRRLCIPPFPIAGENGFELLETTFDLQEALIYC